MTLPTYIIAVEGLDAVQFMEELPKDVERAAVRAVNYATRRGRTKADRAIRKDVAFTAGYLSPSAGRLVVAKTAKNGDLEGIVRARSRATSLARFSSDQPLQPGQRRRRRGVKVTVKPGVAKYIAGAFLVPLKAGVDGPLSNVGLAVRSDTKPSGAYKPKLLGKNLWLLYGPSVSQVLYSARNQGGVADDIAPEVAEDLENEYLRQLDLEIKKDG